MSNRTCNLCLGTSFGDVGKRQSVRCQNCGSFERTRLLWLEIERLPLPQNPAILHIAPEQGLARRLLELTSLDQYVAADLEPDRFQLGVPVQYIDLTDLDAWGSNEFDLIVHSHVLEHVPCNIAYTLFHLHRMLTEDGYHAMCVPFMPGFYAEDYGAAGPERELRFGQVDHVKKFGSSDLSSHLGAILDLEGWIPPSHRFTAELLDRFNIPKRETIGLTGSTVFCLPRTGYRLGKLE